jgi:hypothetical protein
MFYKGPCYMQTFDFAFFHFMFVNTKLLKLFKLFDNHCSDCNIPDWLLVVGLGSSALTPHIENN